LFSPQHKLYNRRNNIVNNIEIVRESSNEFVQHNQNDTRFLFEPTTISSSYVLIHQQGMTNDNDSIEVN